MKALRGTGVALVEADSLALAGRDNDFVVAVGHANPLKFVALVQVDGDQTAAAHILVLIKWSFLYNALDGGHDQILALYLLTDVNYTTNRFFGLEL